jgi:glycosyltransferase involved in cell wall biosynthesis
MSAGSNALPTISVVIPAYNAARHLPATLRSAFAQSHAPVEVIVVDDGSSDDTAAVAHALGARVITVANAGVSNARNVGTHAAVGEYIAYLDADDLWPARKLATQVAALETYGRPAFSFTDYRLFDDRGTYRARGELKRRRSFRSVAQRLMGSDLVVMTANDARPVLTESFILPSSAVVRRADVLAAGGFDAALRAAEDYDFFLRLFKLVPAVVILEPLVLYRQHAAQATSNSTSMRSAISDVASLVAAAPYRYPPGDVRFLARTEYRRAYRLGLQQARLGKFEDALVSFEFSLAARPTVHAYLAKTGARFCRSAAGGRLFSAIRSTWKRRPVRRYDMGL